MFDRRYLEIEIIDLFPIIIVCMIGGMLQSLLGFGCAVIMMAVLPYFLEPFPQVAGLTSVICMICSLMLVLRYRRPTCYRVILPVFISYLFFMTISNKMLISLPVDQLRLYLGFLLVFISLYYFFIAEKTFKFSKSLSIALTVGMASGILSGLFTMGGPPVVLYAMNVSKNKEEYLGMIQFYFTITNFASSVLRTATGIITMKVLYWVIVGLIGIILGEFLGGRLQNKFYWDSLRRWVYVFLGLMGASYIINALAQCRMF
jgi:uncharacterized membrane protein YfcA